MRKIIFGLIVLSMLSLSLLFKSDLKNVSANPDVLCYTKIINPTCVTNSRPCNDTIYNQTGIRFKEGYNKININGGIFTHVTYNPFTFSIVTESEAMEPYTYDKVDNNNCVTKWLREGINYKRTYYGTMTIATVSSLNLHTCHAVGTELFWNRYGGTTTNCEIDEYDKENPTGNPKVEYLSNP